MRMVLVLIAGLMLAMSVPVHADCGGGNGSDDPPAQGCNPGNGGNGGGGEGGGTNTNDNSNTNTNTNTQGQQQGQAQGQAQGQIQGQIATGGDASNDVVIGDTTATGGNVYIGGGYGEEGEGGGSTLSPTSESNSESDSTSISGALASNGDQTTNVNNTDNSFDGGNTLIIGGGQGECYEGECEGGSGTLNSNAENNVDIDNNSNATIEGGAVVVENNVTIEGGEQIPTANNQTVEGDTVDVDVDARTINEAAAIPVNSAAPSFSAICSSGGAGTGKSFSLSLAVTNDVCQCLMVADAYAAMGDMESALKWVEAAARHAKWKGGMGYFRHVITLGVM